MKLHPLLRRLADRLLPGGYGRRLAREQRNYAETTQVHDLPPIFDYWSHTYVRPMLLELGVENPDVLFTTWLRDSATRTGSRNARFLSIGSGNCDTEVRIAKEFLRSGFSAFEIHCLELNPRMLARGRELAAAAGVAGHLVSCPVDCNRWRA